MTVTHTMHTRITEVLTFFAAQRAVLERSVAAVPPVLRTRRPAPERWSVAEVLAHVAVVEGRVVQLLRATIGSARDAGLPPERDTAAIVPTVDLARVLDRSRPITASPAMHPPADADADAAWAALAARHEDLRALLAEADGLALGDVSAPNPVLGPMNAYQWVVFVGGHEARHAAQIDGIAATFAAPDGAGATGTTA